MSDSTTPADGVIPGIGDLAKAGKRLWWLVLIRGILAVVFGILAIMTPLLTLLGLTFVFAAYALIDGVTTIVHAVRARDRLTRWGWLLAQGIVSVLAGLVAVIFPVAAGLVGSLFVLWIIVFWSIVAGIAGFPAAHAMADGGRKVWAYVSSGLSVVFGILLTVLIILNPGDAVLSLVWVLGVYAIVFGIMLVVLAFQVRSGAAAAARTSESVDG